MTETQTREQSKHHNPSLEERAITETTYSTPKDGIICTICKDPYERWEELYYCPKHTTTTQHLDCGKGECTAIGCSHKIIPYLKQKTKEELSDGILKNFESHAAETTSPVQSDYEYYVDELMRRMKAAVSALYKGQGDFVGSYEVPSIENKTNTFNLFIDSCTYSRYENYLAIGFNSMNAGKGEVNKLFIVPIVREKEVVKKKRKWWFFSIKTIEKIKEIEGYTYGFHKERYIDPYLFYENAVWEKDLFNNLKNKPHKTQNVIETLEAICRLPQHIPQIKKQHQEKELQKIKLAQEALLPKLKLTLAEE